MTRLQLDELYQKYLEVIKWETIELNCKATEVRHLIGRLGEFYCARHTNGNLTKLPNQHGFDVVSNEGRTISVKTTAQVKGFVSINSKTLHKADDLMVLQWAASELKIVFYGSIEAAKPSFRNWKDKYEFDLTEAKRLENKEPLKRKQRKKKVQNQEVSQSDFNA